MSTEDDVRRIALALPGASERMAYGTPAFYVARRMFARLRDDPGVLLCWRESVEERDVLVAADPRVFFTTDHYRGHPSVLVRLDEVEPDELAELLTEAWEVRAPRRLREARG